MHHILTIKMKNTYLLIYFIFFSITAKAQFEGKITYKNSYEWKLNDGLTSAQFTAYMGDKMEYYIKEASYKFVSNGMYFNEQIYEPQLNRLYNIVDGSDTLIWIDGSINSDSVINYSIQDTDVIILGHKCKVFIIQTTQGIGRYYFSEDFKLDPKPFNNHHYGNFSMVTSKTKSPSLKIVIENKNFTLNFEATEIKKMKLNDSFFKIPELPSDETSFYLK